LLRPFACATLPAKECTWNFVGRCLSCASDFGWSSLTSRPIIEETARRLAVDVESLQGAVFVTPVRETQLLEIRVQGPNAALVAEVANTLPQVFGDRNRELQLGRVTESKANLEKELFNTEADLARTQAALNTAADDTQRARL
jgi:capsular polysaccharide biosynthesis protein